eukprot:TRINITY_DN4252_c0_g1_i3.p1 TRINITY_DN4252_c0_g1~~TRINITY_DN4252_c0_g1_i3.p1  ORF type:complete len:767 (+),score=251.71 TRINITY_DN4252_c0_g1_i3:80-2380(+)
MDPRYEFEAPKFVDFTKLGSEEDDQGVDSFFDVDMETGQAISGKIAETFDEEIVTTTSSTTTTTETTSVSQQNSSENAQQDNPASTSEEDGKKKGPKNMVKTWGNMKVTKILSQTTKQISSKSSATASSSDDMRKRLRQDTPQRQMRRQAVEETINNVRNSPLNMKPKRLATNQTTPRLNSSQVDTHKQVNRLRTRSKSPGAANLPRTPEAMKRFKNKMAAGMANKQGEMKIKSSGSSHLKVDHQPVKAKAPLKVPSLTQAKEFKFATLERAQGSKSRRRSASVPDAPDFTRMLRSGSTEKINSGPLKLTKPQPFPRLENRKRQHSSSGDEFKSVAEQVNKYQRGTPDRFHTRPRGRSQSPYRMKLRSQSPPACTIPQSPALTLKGRSRPVHVLSQAEREEIELEEAKKHQIRARKVGETVPKYKVPEIEHRPCTIPDPFKVANKMFAKPMAPTEQPVENFHAKPVSKKILEGPVGVPTKKVAPIIEPESPAFRLKERMASRRPMAEPVVEQDRIIRANPVPHYGVPINLPAINKRATVPEPFSFADRDVVTAQKKEEKIKKILDEEKAAREFHANPINKGIEHPRLPEKKAQAPTQVKPFNLKIEERVENRLNKWQDDIKKELEDQRRAANFKANEAKVLNQAPFMPKPSDKPLSEVSNFKLHSDRRAEERQQYEQERLKREVDLEQAKREREVRKKQEEENEVARLRRQAVPKAQPIKAYKGVQIKPSEKPLTMPVSPRLAAKARSNSTFTRGNSTLNSTQKTI